MIVVTFCVCCATVVAQEPDTVYDCQRVPDNAIRVDGRLDEKVWSGLPVIRLAHIKTGKTPSVSSELQFAWTADRLYVGGMLQDENVISTITERDGNLWQEDAVELFVGPVPDQQLPYVEFEVSPRGTLYDILVFHPRKTLRASYEQPWKHNYSPPGVKVCTEQVAGAVPGWRLEMSIPLSAFVLTQRVPLQAGDQWRVGVFRINQLNDRRREEYSWQTVEDGRFHAPEHFGTFRFVDGAE